MSQHKIRITDQEMQRFGRPGRNEQLLIYGTMHQRFVEVRLTVECELSSQPIFTARLGKAGIRHIGFYRQWSEARWCR